MIGQVVTSLPRGRVAAAIFFAVAAVLVVIGAATQSVNTMVFALLPLALALAALASVDPPVEFDVNEDGLSFQQPDVAFIPYSAIRGLSGPGRHVGEDFATQIYHADGVVHIPANLNVSSRDLYEFLLDQLPPVGGPDPDVVPPLLREFVAGQLGLFGPEKVFVFRARTVPPAVSYRRHIRYSLGVLCGAMAWIAVGITMEAVGVKGGVGWIGGGFFLVLMSLLFTLVFSRAGSTGRAANWHESCLVVSPGGIALVQGQLRGKMKWEELRAIEYPARRRMGLTSAGSPREGIGLLVEGAYLIIADYYDRPLAYIRDCLDTYWGGRHAN